MGVALTTDALYMLGGGAMVWVQAVGSRVDFVNIRLRQNPIISNHANNSEKMEMHRALNLVVHVARGCKLSPRDPPTGTQCVACKGSSQSKSPC